MYEIVLLFKWTPSFEKIVIVAGKLDPRAKEHIRIDLFWFPNSREKK